MNRKDLFENIKKKQSFLCVGLDTDIKKIPEHLLQEEDPMPNWDIKIVECPDCPYSTMAVIRILDVKEEEVHLHWFNDEKPVNG